MSVLRRIAAVGGMVAAVGCVSTPRATPPGGPDAAVRPTGGISTARALHITNNHELAYRGPVRVPVNLPDGIYAGGDAAAVVRQGIARAVVALPADGSVSLTSDVPAAPRSLREGPLAATMAPGRLDLAWANEAIGALELGLVVVPGTAGQPDDAVRRFEPLRFPWAEQADGTLRGTTIRDGYAIEVTLERYGGGWLDVYARLARADGVGARDEARTDGGGSRDAAGPEPAYVALVRRLTTPGATSPRVRFNGRVFQAAASPDTWDRDFWYTRGVDWLSWRAGGRSLAVVNGWTPAPTVKRGERWAEGSHFYVWERTRHEGDALYLISEVSGPNPEQVKSRYMPVTPYAPLLSGDTVDLKWRLAVHQGTPDDGWEESQLRGFAGYRSVSDSAGVHEVSLGVREVLFGTAYFPYSTLTENFDFYRTAGLDRETFWAFSPVLWTQWRTLVPRMTGDLHIIRAMGFAAVRLHHLELLQQMERAEALAFLDYFTGVARELGLRILIDTEGPAEWVSEISRRYADVLMGVELENEILIPGIRPGDAERWTALYHAAKSAHPTQDVFLTSAGNNGMFERLLALGVPFDRVGVHAYKHGPQWIESFGSHLLGTAGYASDIGKPVTLGEFNWKEFTRHSPEERLALFRELYETVLRPRAIPHFFQFQFQESLSFNPAIAGTYTRHYETIALDRRPKPEAFELMRLIREYGPKGAPVNALPVAVTPATVVRGRATAAFTVHNALDAEITLRLEARGGEGVTSRLTTPAEVTLAAGQVHEGRVELTTAARPGTYHHFVVARYGPTTSPAETSHELNVGWGVASNPGAPTFEPAPVLGERVRYPQGAGMVNGVDWTRPLAVAFGEKASVIEVETAYTIMNTLQSATGRPVRLSSVADLPDSLRRAGTVLLLGTQASNSLIGAPPAGAKPKQGIVLHDTSGGRQWLLLTGADAPAVQAAAIDVVLRYWKNAKDATTRISGMERGNALGNRAGVGEVDLP